MCQVIAYTFSTLHVEMLRHFTNVNCRLPNVVIGRITRDSFRRALAAGIGAKTIVNFLKSHVHPSVRAKKGRLIPENVEAQIELWNREQARVRYEEAALFDVSTLDAFTFEVIRRYAEDSQVLLWASTLDGHADVKAGVSKGPGLLGDGVNGKTNGDSGEPRRLRIIVKPEAADSMGRFIEDRIQKIKRDSLK
jgi:transcription initiation factor TFIIH subunit 4